MRPGPSRKEGLAFAQDSPESEDRYRLLVESVQDYAIFALDPTGHVVTWNAGAKRLKGYTASEIIGSHFSRFYPPEAVAAGRCEQLLRTAAEAGRVEEESWRVRKDGTHFWASVVITALRSSDGALVGFAKVTRDLTTRHQAEEQLRQSEERFRLLVEVVEDYAIFMLGPGGEVATWNAGAQRIKGYAASEIIGRHYSVFYPPEVVATGHCDEQLERAQQLGHIQEEGWRVRKDGTRFWASVVLSAMRDRNGVLLGFAKVTRDLSERRAAEAQRLRLAEEREANRIRDEFLATISHELRTPLHAILGWSAILTHRVSDPQLAKALQAIVRNAEAQAKLVDDMLDMSRIISGKLRLEAKPMDLAVTVRAAVDVVRPAAAAKGLRLRIGDLEEPALLIGDHNRLQQVVWNLVSNAVKFTERGSVTVSLVHDGPKLRVTVTDTGKGIDADFLPYVFDRFRQADSSTTRRFGGLGLGLSIVRHLVELHGGTVAVISEGPDRGATFEVWLPVHGLALGGVVDEGTEAELAPVGRRRLAGVKVVIVDDEPDALHLLAELLRDEGAEVREASSAVEALAAIERELPDVLVSDIAMPEQDGYQLIRSIRALPPLRGGATPAVALTAYARDTDRARALDDGFDRHLAKPVDPEDLMTMILGLLGRRVSGVH